MDTDRTMSAFLTHDLPSQDACLLLLAYWRFRLLGFPVLFSGFQACMNQGDLLEDAPRVQRAPLN